MKMGCPEKKDGLGSGKAQDLGCILQLSWSRRVGFFPDEGAGMLLAK